MLNIHCKIDLSQIPNQPKPLLLTMPDNPLPYCAARLHKFDDLTKPSLQNVQDEMKQFVCLSYIAYLKLLCYRIQE